MSLRAILVRGCLAAGWGCASALAGPPPISHSDVPVPVTGGLAFIEISAGESTTCALTASGQTYCWGENGRWDGSLTPASRPVPVAKGLVLRKLSVGSSHVCGLTSAGEAYCWGDNSYGQLGVSSTGATHVPVRVSGGISFADIVAGIGFTCGLTAAGDAYCWGNNSRGDLGDGTRQNSAMPVAVASDTAFAVLTGRADPCGITTAGMLYCWGDRLPGAVRQSATPVRPFPSAVLQDARIGLFHGCLIFFSGEVACWGNNELGQLGNGTRTAVDPGTPLRIGTDRPYVRVVTGWFFTCGLDASGNADCWGRRLHGSLGTTAPPETCPLPNAAGGSVPETCNTRPVPVGGGLRFVRLTAGMDYACGLTAEGRAYCWGENSNGRLGTGS